MLFSFKKYDKEIEALGHLKNDQAINPLQKEQIKQSLMQKLETGDAAEPTAAKVYSVHHFSAHFIRYAASTVFGLALIGGTAFASSVSKPGDMLFPVKKAVDHVRLNLTSSEEARAQISTSIAEDRISDIDKVEPSVKQQAVKEAENEVNNAINVLTDVQTKLEEKGNAQAASAVAQNIFRLKTHAKEHSLEVNKESENQDTQSETEGDANGSVKGASDSNKKNQELNLPSPTANPTLNEQENQSVPLKHEKGKKGQD